MPSYAVPRQNVSLYIPGAERSKEGDLRLIPPLSHSPVKLVVLELLLCDYLVVKNQAYSDELRA